MSFFYKIELVFYKGFYPLITNNRDPCRLNHTTQLGIDWRNGILLHYNATLNQDWQGTELAQGGSVPAAAEELGRSTTGWTVFHSNDSRWSRISP